MADFTIYIILLAGIIAGGQYLRSFLRTSDQHRLFKTPQEWLQRRLSSTTNQSCPPSSKPTNTLADILPPSRRPALPDHFTLERHDSVSFVLERQVDMEVDSKSYEPTHCTPTAITIDEIDSLGRFPDYASLSGVPLPQPYPEFNIDTALPRPYRPFRWHYHQTMCMSPPRT